MSGCGKGTTETHVETEELLKMATGADVGSVRLVGPRLASSSVRCVYKIKRKIHLLDSCTCNDLPFSVLDVRMVITIMNRSRPTLILHTLFLHVSIDQKDSNYYFQVVRITHVVIELILTSSPSYKRTLGLIPDT